MAVEISVTKRSPHKYKSVCRFYISIHYNKLNVIERRILNVH